MLCMTLLIFLFKTSTISIVLVLPTFILLGPRNHSDKTYWLTEEGPRSLMEYGVNRVASLAGPEA